MTIVTKAHKRQNHKVTKLGAKWNNGLNTSAFYWNLNNASSNRNRNISSQLVNALKTSNHTRLKYGGCFYKQNTEI